MRGAIVTESNHRHSPQETNWSWKVLLRASRKVAECEPGNGPNGRHRSKAVRAYFVFARRPHKFTTPCFGFIAGDGSRLFVALAGRLVQMIGMIGNLATPNQIPSTPLAGRFALSSPNSVERQRGTAGSAVALKIVTAHSRSAQNLGEQRGGAVLCAAARPVNIKKGIFPALASLFITLVVTPFGWADVDTIDGTVAVLPTRRDEPGPRSRTASRRQRSTMSSTASVARC